MADDVRKKQVRLSLGTKPRKFINFIGITCFGSTELQCEDLLMSPLNNDQKQSIIKRCVHLLWKQKGTSF